jgi:hypothetical protein
MTDEPIFWHGIVRMISRDTRRFGKLSIVISVSRLIVSTSFSASFDFAANRSVICTNPIYAGRRCSIIR